ncbi:MlaD family protein [Rhodopirellula europaea]|uniref:Protein containing Mammalian cell entry related domain protein n=1 Tax=Rhodopirellula europaea 6C TaxID=1263867 RepID=M2AY54_9BACT|nr:MlaD family protein [Rhodopirellula europaea]EMB14458.1 protein containing Mammalian cell entry related domain protein [Rhodopirellula europaea 6C]
MDDSRLRFGVGVLVIAAIGIAVILTFLFGAFPAILNREYTLNVYFPSADGINVNAPVYRDGVKIGRVDDIRLQEEGGVRLILSMDESVSMTHQYIPQIGIGSLITGDSKLEFRKADRRELIGLFDDNPDLIEQPYTDGELFDYGKKLEDPFSLIFGMEDELVSTFRSVRGAGDAIQNIGSDIKGLVRDVRGVIGLSPTAPVSSPSVPMGGFPQSMAPAPEWARPIVLATHSSPQDATSKGVIQQVAMQQPLPQQGMQQPTIPPQGFTPPQGFGTQLGTPLPGQQGMQTPPTITQLAGDASQAVKEFSFLVRDIRSIIGDPQIQRSVSDTVDRLPGVLDEVKVTLEDARETFETFRDVGGQFEQVGIVAEDAVSQTANELQSTLRSVRSTAKSFEGTAENIEAFTEPLGERGGELIEAVLVSLANVDNALVQLDTFGRTLNSSDGTVRRLLEDDELFYQVQRTVQNIEAASARLRPILDDVRVFSDKIARDPRQLGVRGAITNRPSGMGLK